MYEGNNYTRLYSNLATMRGKVLPPCFQLAFFYYNYLNERLLKKSLNDVTTFMCANSPLYDYHDIITIGINNIVIYITDINFLNVTVDITNNISP